jgi:acyl carrier protein
MPAPDRNAIVASLHRVIDTINEQLPKAKKLGKSPDLVLVGPGSTVDSLTQMNLVVETEGRFADDFGVDLALADAIGLPPAQNPFRTLDTLADDLAVRVATP